MRAAWILAAWSLLAGCTNEYDTFVFGGTGLGTSTTASTSTGASASAGSAGAMSGSSSGGGGGGQPSATSSGSGGMGGMAGPGGAGGSGSCAAYAVLRDDFDDGAIGPQWVALGAASPTVATESGGVLEITIGDTADQNDHYAGYESAAAHDLTECEVHVQVTSLPTTSALANAYFGIFQDNSNGVYFSAYFDNIHCRFLEADNVTTPGELPYDENQHRWWRLRESGGMTYCETSPDAATWSLLGAAPTPPYIAAGYVQVAGGSFGAVLAGGKVRYDNLNYP